MIKFFRRIRYDLMEKNKTGKYFKYAIGEIVLVVIGILIALQVNNWNQDRIAQIEADSFLERLKEDLLTEKIMLQQRILYYTKVEEHAKNVINTLSNKTNVLDAQFLIDAYQASQQWRYRNVRDTYDELISTGNIKLIPDQDLRKRIGLYYDETDVYIKVWYIDHNYRELVRSHIFMDVQEKIREACEIWTEIDQQIGGNAIVENCEPNFTEEEISKSITFLHETNLIESNALLIAAIGRTSDLYLKLGLYERKLNGNEELFKLLDERTK